MTPATPSRAVTLVWTVAGALAMAWYLGWLAQPGRSGFLPLFALLVAADLFNGFHAITLWLTCLRPARPRRPAPQTGACVDVLIPTYNEPPAVLDRTVGAAVAMRGADVRVFVLDDGARPEIEALAQRWNAEYVARSDHSGAKSGNLNHALRATDGDGAELVAVFDSDHAPHPDFLEKTLGHFADPGVDIVQTPQVYGNGDAGPLTRAAAEQQAIFFGPICRGKDGWDAAFCCGTNFVARRWALEDAGLFPEDSVTEDIVLSMHIVQNGGHIVYDPEPLSTGLGPEDARSYLRQQDRWARGCLDLLLRRPGAWRGLTWTQRWQYAASASYWLTGWTFLIYLMLPATRIVVDAPVVRASADEFLVHFMPYFLLAIVSLGRFTAGAYSIRGIALNWGCFGVHIRATVRVLAGRPGGFAVTSKRALLGMPWGQLAPNLVVGSVLVGTSLYALLGGVTPAVLGNVSFAMLNATLATLIVGFSLAQARRVRVARPAMSPASDEPAPRAEVQPAPEEIAA